MVAKEEVGERETGGLNHAGRLAEIPVLAFGTQR